MLERSGAGAVQPSGRGTDGFHCRALRQRWCPLRASHLLLRALGARHGAPPPLSLPHNPAAGRRSRYHFSRRRRGRLRAAPGACARPWLPAEPVPRTRTRRFSASFRLLKRARPLCASRAAAGRVRGFASPLIERGAGSASRLRDAQQLPAGQALPGNFRCDEETQRFYLPGVFAEQGVSLIIVRFFFLLLFVCFPCCLFFLGCARCYVPVNCCQIKSTMNCSRGILCWC